jgi:hypothetical protein
MGPQPPNDEKNQRMNEGIIAAEAGFDVARGVKVKARRAI